MRTLNNAKRGIRVYDKAPSWRRAKRYKIWSHVDTFMNQRNLEIYISNCIRQGIDFKCESVPGGFKIAVKR